MSNLNFILIYLLMFISNCKLHNLIHSLELIIASNEGLERNVGKYQFHMVTYPKWTRLHSKIAENSRLISFRTMKPVCLFCQQEKFSCIYLGLQKIYVQIHTYYSMLKEKKYENSNWTQKSAIMIYYSSQHLEWLCQKDWNTCMINISKLHVENSY